MIDLRDPRIKRFPRLYPGKKRKKLTIDKVIKQKVEYGLTPVGYDKLTKRQKKLARLVVNGDTVKDACKKTGFDTNTYYRYQNYHKLFRRYYLNYAQSLSTHVEGRINAKLGRAVRVVEDAMDGPDPYHRSEVAIQLLKGRGVLKKSVDTKSQVSGRIDLTNKTPEKPMNEKLVLAVVEAMKTLATGGRPEVRPKIINAEVIKQLPAETANIVDDDGIHSKVQEARQEEAP